MERISVPKGHRVLPAVWAMRRKRRISTGKVYKWKARLNIDGGKQEKGINYWETYAGPGSHMVVHSVNTSHGGQERMGYKTIRFCPSIPTSSG